MATVELIYDLDCPNVSSTRVQLLRAFTAAKQTPRWVEWDRNDPESPAHVRGYGSPTVLIDGDDVAGVPASDGVASCRLYADPTGELRGVPPVAAIARALQNTDENAKPDEGARQSGWLGSLAVLPGIGATLLPVGLCPACWPAYAGILSALGLGFLLDAAYLLPVTSLFLLVALGALAYRARSRRGFGPFLGGVVASAGILAGKFILSSDAVTWGGIVLLVAASIWNAWPQRANRVKVGACPQCAPAGPAPPSLMGANEVTS